MSLQVSVLTDQIDAQAEKIRDLEYCLAERREKLISAEDMLQSVSHYVIFSFRSECMLMTNIFKNMSCMTGCFNIFYETTSELITIDISQEFF